MRHGLEGAEVIDGDNFYRRTRCSSRAKEVAPNTPKSVNANTNR
jgi:hypothetical protein